MLLTLTSLALLFVPVLFGTGVFFLSSTLGDVVSRFSLQSMFACLQVHIIETCLYVLTRDVATAEGAYSLVERGRERERVHQVCGPGRKLVCFMQCFQPVVPHSAPVQTLAEHY